jgi:hypothetical protein
MAADTLLKSQHPAPARAQASLWSLCLSLTAPPLAWSIQSVAGYGLSSRACYPGDQPRNLPLFHGLLQILLSLNGMALAIGVLGIVLAYRNWRATRRESGGDAQHLIERGEGRTRFLSMCGLLISAGFLVATLFTSVTLLISPLCR